MGADLDPDAGPLALLDDVPLSDDEAGYRATLGPQSAPARAVVLGAGTGREREMPSVTVVRAVSAVRENDGTTVPSGQGHG